MKTSQMQFFFANSLIHTKFHFFKHFSSRMKVFFDSHLHGFHTTLTIFHFVILYLFKKQFTVLYNFILQHSRTVVKCVHYLHFAGLVWFPILATQWFMCIEAITIPSLLSSQPDFVMNYAPSTLNGCFGSSTNCYNSYLFGHVEILIISIASKYSF